MTSRLTLDDSLWRLPGQPAPLAHKKSVSALALTPDAANTKLRELIPTLALRLFAIGV